MKSNYIEATRAADIASGFLVIEGETEMKKTAQKTADIRFRVELKNKPWIVVYTVRSSDDTQDYHVTVVRGKVNNCDCISRKPCYHMRDVQVREDARKAPVHVQVQKPVYTEDIDDPFFHPEWAGKDAERNQYLRVAMSLGWE